MKAAAKSNSPQAALTLVPAFRPFLKKPLGKLLSASSAVKLAANRQSRTPIIAVGDVTALLFFSHGITPGLAVVDLRVQRKPLARAGVRKLRSFKGTKLADGCPNAQGTISASALKQLGKAFRLLRGGATVIMFIEGEEDLLLLPSVLLAPVGALLFYGQPGRGVVVLKATAEEKKRIGLLIEKCFKPA